MSSEQRNIFVHNPHSTRAERVSALVNRLTATDLQYEVHETPSPRAEDNIDWVANLVQPGDRIFSAAGDGTASQIGEGVLGSELSDIELAFGPFGNFNDGPASLGRINPVDFFDGNIATRPLRPIEVDQDGERHTALFYATLGWTAGLAMRFMTGNREKMKASRNKMVRRMSDAAFYYALHGRDKLPGFTVDDDPIVHDQVSDVLLHNSSVMAGLVRGRDFMSGSTFGLRELNVGNLPKNVPFLFNSVVRGKTPSTAIEAVTLKFTDPAGFYLMRDGESERVEGVNELTFRKYGDGPTLQVATTKS